MSDLADRADHLIHAEIATVLHRTKLAMTKLDQQDAACIMVETVKKPDRFCDVRCLNDYDVEQAARRRAGLSG